MKKYTFILIAALVCVLVGSPKLADEVRCEGCVIGHQSVGRGDDLIVNLTNKCGQVADVDIWLKCNKRKINLGSSCLAPGSSTRRVKKCFGRWKFYWDYKLVENKSQCTPENKGD